MRPFGRISSGKPEAALAGLSFTLGHRGRPARGAKGFLRPRRVPFPLTTNVHTPFGGLSTDNPPIHLALQQRFEIMIALFQNSEPQEGYSPWPDA
jgi:hypothetical protein